MTAAIETSAQSLHTSQALMKSVATVLTEAGDSVAQTNRGVDNISASTRGQQIRVLQDWCAPFEGYYLYYPSRRQLSPAFSRVVDVLRFKEGKRR